jgi:hypothetical protein
MFILLFDKKIEIFLLRNKKKFIQILYHINSTLRIIAFLENI